MKKTIRTIRLMNSAMMPNDGVYRKATFSKEAFKAEFDAHRLAGAEIKSYIGYPETARILSELLKFDVKVSRDETTLDFGDVMLVARLKYRVNPTEKATNRKQTIEDFEFSEIYFSEK